MFFCCFLCEGATLDLIEKFKSDGVDVESEHVHLCSYTEWAAQQGRVKRLHICTATAISHHQLTNTQCVLHIRVQNIMSSLPLLHYSRGDSEDEETLWRTGSEQTLTQDGASQQGQVNQDGVLDEVDLSVVDIDEEDGSDL